MAEKSPQSELQRVRLDKWLWAARFYKTRAVAKQAIESGKVHCDGGRSKPAKEIIIGTTLKLRHGIEEKVVIVKALSEQRRGAPQAQLLYEETEASIAARQKMTDQRKAQPSYWASADKPNKKERRAIHKFKQGG